MLGRHVKHQGQIIYLPEVVAAILETARQWFVSSFLQTAAIDFSHIQCIHFVKTIMVASKQTQEILPMCTLTNFCYLHVWPFTRWVLNVIEPEKWATQLGLKSRTFRLHGDCTTRYIFSDFSYICVTPCEKTHMVFLWHSKTEKQHQTEVVRIGFN